MTQVFREANVVAHCSVQPEPFGRVVVEAMLCGRPVVVSGEGGVSEIVQHGVTGLHHVPGNVVSFASRLRELLDHPEEALKLARVGERTARERYSLDHVAEQTMAVLEMVRHSPGRTGRARLPAFSPHPSEAIKAPSLP